MNIGNPSMFRKLVLVHYGVYSPISVSLMGVSLNHAIPIIGQRIGSYSRNNRSSNKSRKSALVIIVMRVEI